MLEEGGRAGAGPAPLDEAAQGAGGDLQAVPVG